MPKLDRLYQQRKGQGFIVFGLSDEGIPVQQKFLEQVPVSYPLLTLSGEVPNLYRDIARYPAIFLIDRKGQLQPAPGPDQSFEKVEAAVDGLLKTGIISDQSDCRNQAIAQINFIHQDLVVRIARLLASLFALFRQLPGDFLHKLGF